MPREFVPPSVCPVCGESVPSGALACPHCGADERSGWDEDAARYDGLDLPDEAFGPGDRPASDRAIPRLFWPVVGTGLILLLIYVLILR